MSGRLVFCLIYFLFNTWLQVCGQDLARLDSLKIMETNAEGLRKVELLNELSLEYLSLDPKIALDYAQNAYNQAIMITSPSEIITALLRLSEANAMLGKNQEAISYYKKLLSYYQDKQQLNRQIFIYSEIGHLFLSLNETPQALSYYTKALAASHQLQDSMEIALCNFNIAQVLTLLNDNHLAIKKFKEAVKGFDKANEWRMEGVSFENLIELYLKEEDFKSALYYGNLAFQLYQKIENREGMAFLKNKIAKVYFLQNRLDIALVNAQQSLQISEEIDSAVGIYEASETLYKLFKKLNKFQEALTFFEKYELYRDSIQSNHREMALSEINYKHEFIQQSQQIELLRQNESLNNIKIEKQRSLILYFVSISILLLLISIILYREIKVRKEKNNILKLQNLEIRKREQESIKQNKALIRQRDKIRLQNEHLIALDEEKNHLMGIVAHDLQAPLNKITSFAHLVELSGALNSEQEDMLKRMNMVINNGKRLIRDVLDLHALEENRVRLKPEEFPLHHFLSDIIETHQVHAKRKKIQLLFENQANGVVLQTDKGHLTRVLDNLISNAVKFSQHERSVMVKLRELEDKVFITVKDEGPGISEAEKKKLFKKFAQLSNRPTGGESSSGLGLSIIKGLVEVMQGEILVKSKVGEGSEFIVSFPKFTYK